MTARVLFTIAKNENNPRVCQLNTINKEHKYLAEPHSVISTQLQKGMMY
jgi:hypothetical protein